MSHIISHSHHETIVEYSLEYLYKNDRHSGFSFPCDKDGNVAELAPSGLKNLQNCQSGEYQVDFMGITENERDILHPTVVKCDCGKIHHLHYEEECECGRCFNIFGQELETLRDEDQDGDFYSDDQF